MATITTSPAVTPFADLLDLSEKVAIVTGGAKGNPPTPVSENKPRGDGVRWQPVHWCRLSAKGRHEQSGLRCLPRSLLEPANRLAG